MHTEKTFFSYSRTDSDLVLKLAKDLRDAGADLWLDQLDIKPGDHWDSTVESALKHSGRLIVILSPTSVASNNVRDEVSFALENGKVVIPVLIKPCEVPFRWQRLQRVDITADYPTGVRQLLAALGYGNKGSATARAPEKEDAVVRDRELERLLWEKARTVDERGAYEHYLDEYPEGRHRAHAAEALKRLAERPPVTTGARRRSMWPWIMGVLVLAAAGAGAWAYFRPDLPTVEEQMAAAEKEAWALANAGSDSASFAAYLSMYPNGKSAGVAQQMLKDYGEASRKHREQINEQARLRQERDSLHSAVSSEARKRATLDSIGIGKTFHGGRVFTWDPATRTGTILAEVDPAEGGKVDWARAQQLCEDLRHDGFTDWRMPTIEELVEVHKTRNHDALAQGESNLYWSSSSAGDKIMRLMNFGYGSPNYRYSTTRPYRVCAVRVFEAFERVSQ